MQDQWSILNITHTSIKGYFFSIKCCKHSEKCFQKVVCETKMPCTSDETFSLRFICGVFRLLEKTWDFAHREQTSGLNPFQGKPCNLASSSKSPSYHVQTQPIFQTIRQAAGKMCWQIPLFLAMTSFIYICYSCLSKKEMYESKLCIACQ